MKKGTKFVFRNGDSVLHKKILNANAVSNDKTKVRTYRQIDGRVWIPAELLRAAKNNEITAGWREGSKEYDLYWYGQSEAEAIKEHNIWQSELIEGGAMFVGDNSKIVQMVKDFDVEEQSQ